MLRIVPLTAPEHFVPPEPEVGPVNGRSESYPEKGNEDFAGKYVRLSDGEYLQREVRNGVGVLMWSTAAPVRTVLERVVASVGRPLNGDLDSGFFAVADPSDSYSAWEGPSTDIYDAILESTEHVSYVRLNFDEFTLCWRQPFKKFYDSESELGELSVSADTKYLEQKIFVEMILKTATPGIAKELTGLVIAVSL